MGVQQRQSANMSSHVIADCQSFCGESRTVADVHREDWTDGET